ncbi:uncharacterized protein LOC131605011 [Vicia villosa]|uniref:uncharacterized protein LOC131605011 n=1 Tax=Vicia villosa TaxID=3911 RepID=UPI00273B3C27|nr:uncharacterized protein LOC131605011 [Vicia villosa]
MNKALLLNWKWRILKEDKAIWSKFLLLRYLNPKLKVLASCEEVLNREDSSWWKDVILNDFKEESSDEGFSDWVNCKFKKGNNTLFWHSCWLGDQTLSTSFPYLFDLSTNKLCANIDAIVGIERMLPPGSFGGDSAGASQLRDLNVLLNGIEPDNSDFDDFHWNLTSNGCFLVSSVSTAVSNAKDSAWITSTIKLSDVVWKGYADEC